MNHVCFHLVKPNSIHRSTQMCIEHSLAVLNTTSHDYSQGNYILIRKETWLRQIPLICGSR